MGPANYLALRASGAALSSYPYGLNVLPFTEFSVCAWVHYAADTSNALIAEIAGVMELNVVNNGVSFSLSPQSAVRWMDGTRSLTEGWHFIAATVRAIDKKTALARIYFDGQLKLEAPIPPPDTPPGLAPMALGGSLHGRIRRVSFYIIELSATQIADLEFEQLAEDKAPKPWADFDFRQNPPYVNGMKGDFAKPDIFAYTPALELQDYGFAVPVHDEGVNPGGRQVDPYTVQAWVYVKYQAPTHVILVNSDIDRDAGIGLRLIFDAATGNYAFESRRGSLTTGTAVTSAATISANSWVNLATTFDGTTLTVYVNGTSSGTPVTAGPITEALYEGEIMIGAAFAPMRTGGVDTLQGYIAGVDVWDTALTATQISNYCTAAPSIDAPGLVARYDMSVHPATNWVTGNSLALGDATKVSAQHSFVPAPPGGGGHWVSAVDSDETKGTGPEVEPATLERWRAALDPAALYDGQRRLMEDACRRDMAAAATPEDVATIRSGYAAAALRYNAGVGPDMPVMFSRHVENGRFYFVSHSRRGSFVLLNEPEAASADCDMWRVSIFLIILGGFLDIFGIDIPKTINKGGRACMLILRVLKDPRVEAVFGSGSAITAGNILRVLEVTYELGVLRTLVTALLTLSFWVFLGLIFRLILSLTPAKVAATIANLAATVVLLIIAFNNRPASCTAPPAIVLKAIKFRHCPLGKAVQALPARQDRFTPIEPPEWRCDSSSVCSVVYAVDQVTGKTVTIRAAFETDTRAAMSAVISATGTGRLGSTNAVTVNFLNGKSVPEYVEFELASHTIGQDGIQKNDFSLLWSYTPPTVHVFRSGVSGEGMDKVATPPPPVTIRMSTGTTYEVLTTPTAPWNVASMGPEQPWIDALEAMASSVRGCTNPDSVAKNIVNALYANGHIAYDTVAGTTHYVSNVNDFSTFDLTQFSARITGKTAGNGGLANCTDYAAAVVTYANLHGCDIYTKVLGETTTTPSGGRAPGSFACNKVMLAGRSANGWVWPFATAPGGPGDFGYHEVGRKEDNQTGYIYDASLKIDRGNYPWWWSSTPATPHEAGGEGFEFDPKGNEPWKLPDGGYSPLAEPYSPLLYRTRLAWNTAGGIPKCQLVGVQPKSNGGRRPFV